MQSSVDFVGLIRHVGSVKEDYCAIRETHSDCIFILAVFDCQNDAYTRDVFDEPHSSCVIDAHETQVLFVKNNFVDACEIVDLLNKTVMCCFILDVGLHIAHVDIAVRA